MGLALAGSKKKMIFQLCLINMAYDNNKAALERKGTVVPRIKDSHLENVVSG